jgi:CBS domain-containing protein
MVLYARDIVETNFLTLPSKTSVRDGAKKMSEARRGFAVIGSPDDPQGIVTEWDIVSKVVAQGKSPDKVTMGEVMSTELVSIDAGAGIAAVSQLMSERGVRRLLVKDGDKVLGFITSKTMLARMNEYVDKVSSQISRLQAPWF